MSMWFEQDSDAFDPKEVAKGEARQRRIDADVGPGGMTRYCSQCRRNVGASACDGCVCEHCGATLRSIWGKEC